MIRLATQDDEEHLEQICHKFFQTTNHNDLTYSRQKVKTLIRSFTGGDIDTHIFLLAEDKLGTIFSILAGFTTEHIFTDNKIAYELIWYVDPLYRHRKDNLLIIKAYEAWAKRVGCSHCSMGNRRGVSDSKEDALERYYLKNNYKIIETIYKKEF